MKYINEDTHN